MARYSKGVADKIFKLVSEDSYTIIEICKIVGIGKSTYYDWKRDKPNFSEGLKKAEEERYEKFAKVAENSLLKKIQGYDVEEVKTIYVEHEKDPKKAKVKQRTITTKHIQADTGAIIFALTNRNPTKWQNKQYTKLGLDEENKVDFSSLLKQANQIDNNENERG